MLSDQELFEALKREGDCWFLDENFDHDGMCEMCDEYVDVHSRSPNFTNPTPADVSWIRRRINWEEFIRFLARNGEVLSGRYPLLTHGPSNFFGLWVLWEQKTDKEQVELVRKFMEGR